MKVTSLLAALLSLSLIISSFLEATEEEKISLRGIDGIVEVYRDPWGISHIYAETESDLFFAQGFNAARDRLFQLELWRMKATGTLSEVFARRTLDQDIGARLLQYRGNLSEELQHYHPRGVEIIQSFVNGINAYIDLVNEESRRLPIEFRLLGIEPKKWTPEVVISRHNGLFRNASTELDLFKAARKLGPDQLTELLNLEPAPARIEIPEKLDYSIPAESVLHLYQASRASIDVNPEDILIEEWRGNRDVEESAASLPFQLPGLGSNNWIIASEKSLTGAPLLANDPHRSIEIPSLRYFVHLSGAGWDVIGGGEPALPGISIGHNRHGAWGLTIFSVDQEDIYVYETNPANPSQYRYQDDWESMDEIEETFQIKDSDAEKVILKFTRHGPVLFEDLENHRAYALRAAWLEKGTSPYLPSLRFGKARSWSEFRAACTFFLAPSENMVWADREGNIGWQATGITPIRKNWNGLTPVPGDGSYEWEGFLPVSELPSVTNPPENFFATANQENLPAGFKSQVGLMWAPPFRFSRIQDVLSSRGLFSLADMMSLQQDFYSQPARWLIPLLKPLNPDSVRLTEAIDLLSHWNFELTSDSAAAAIYMSWQRELTERVWDLYLPDDLQEDFEFKSLRKTIDWILAPDSHFGENPVEGRDRLLLEALRATLEELEALFGSEMEFWRWGDPLLHHVKIEHPLSPALKESYRARLDVGPFPRGGSGETVNMTNSGNLQTSGATFRLIADLANWDLSLATNAPGQSGDSESEHYRDLMELWARGGYFPLLYSRAKIEAAARSKMILIKAEGN